MIAMKGFALGDWGALKGSSLILIVHDMNSRVHGMNSRHGVLRLLEMMPRSLSEICCSICEK
jgi:hypothetical protein